MRIKNGQYYYGPHRSLWGIWQWQVGENGAGFGTFIKDCSSRDEARDEVYALNGWKEKK